jgi:hypothetical protein
MRPREHAQRRLVAQIMLAGAALQGNQACGLGKPAMRYLHGCYPLVGIEEIATFARKWLRKHPPG